MSMFTKATRRQTKARIALMGTAGSGKTRTALKIARCLGDRICVGDSENRSASLFVGLDGIEFDEAAIETPYTIEKYLKIIQAAQAEKYDVLILDSLSHCWAGEGGALERVDRIAAKTGNSFTSWSEITPLQNKLLAAIQSCKIHLICTLRSKTAYILEERLNRKGELSQVPVKKGLAPIQRKELEYEFTVVGELNHDHKLSITKSRVAGVDLCDFDATEIEELGQRLRVFHDTGEVVAPEGDRVGPWFPKSWNKRHDGDYAKRPMRDANPAVLFEFACDCVSTLGKVDADMQGRIARNRQDALDCHERAVGELGIDELGDHIAKLQNILSDAGQEEFHATARTALEHVQAAFAARARSECEEEQLGPVQPNGYAAAEAP